MKLFVLVIVVLQNGEEGVSTKSATDKINCMFEYFVVIESWHY